MSIRVIAKKIEKDRLVLEIPNSGETITWPIDMLEEPLEIGSALNIQLTQSLAESAKDKTTSKRPNDTPTPDEMEKRRKLLEELVN
jgi:hypothetical protein